MQAGEVDRDRAILVRHGVGITARIVQRSDLRFSRVRFDQPTLIVVRSGTKVLHGEGQSWTITSGQAVAVAAGQSLDIVNSMTSRGAYEASWLIWDHDLHAGFAGDANAPGLHTVQVIKPDPMFTETLGRAVQAIAEPNRLSASVACHRMTEVLVWLSEIGIRFEAAPVLTLDQKVRQLLRARLGHDWTATDVAAALAMSPATLRRHLAATGTTFGHLLIDVRMSMAMQLLQSTDQPISHIAQDLGYASSSRFALRFRSRFGFAPTAIRGHRRNGAVVA